MYVFIFVPTSVGQAHPIVMVNQNKTDVIMSPRKETRMTRKLLLMASLAVLESLAVALPAHAMKGTKADQNDAARS